MDNEPKTQAWKRLLKWGGTYPDLILKSLPTDEKDPLNKFGLVTTLRWEIPWEAFHNEALLAVGPDEGARAAVETLYKERDEISIRNLIVKAGKCKALGQPLARLTTVKLWDPDGDLIASLGFLGEKSVAPRFVELLGSTDGSTNQEFLVDALVRIGDKSVIPQLLDLLEKPGPTRQAAVDILGRMGEKSMASRLAKLMSDKTADPALLRATADALVKLGDASVAPRLVGLLESEDEKFRVGAAYALGRLKRKSAATQIVKCMDKNPAWPRPEYLEALGELGDKSTAPRVAKFLEDGHSEVRVAAAVALMKLGDKTVSQKFIKQLEDGDCAKQIEAIHVLGEMGEKKAIPNLQRFLEPRSPLHPIAERGWCFNAAAIVLARLGDASVIPELKECLGPRDKSQSNVEVLECLAALGDRTAAPCLARFLNQHARRWPEMIRAAAALSKLVGEPWGDDVVSARIWWEKHKADPEFAEKGRDK